MESSWWIATPLESSTGFHLGSGSCSKDVKSCKKGVKNGSFDCFFERLTDIISFHQAGYSFLNDLLPLILSFLLLIDHGTDRSQRDAGHAGSIL